MRHKVRTKISSTNKELADSSKENARGVCLKYVERILLIVVQLEL